MGLVLSCLDRRIKDRTLMTPTKLVYTAYGVWAWSSQDITGQYWKHGSPKAGDPVTEEDMAYHTKNGFGEEILLSAGCIAPPGASYVDKLFMAEPLQEWIDSSPETPMEPLWPSIDAHHHFQPAQDFKSEPLLPAQAHHSGVKVGALTPERLAEDWKGNNVVGSVFLEAGYMYDQGSILRTPPCPPLGETQAVQAISDKSATPIAIVGHIDLTLGRDRVKEHVAMHQAAGQNFVGVRHGLAWTKLCLGSTKLGGAPEEISKQESFREGMKVLAEEGLTYEAWLFHWNLKEFIELAQACPDTQMICDHIGGPVGTPALGFSLEATMKEWKPLIAELAKCENVSMKLGGCGMVFCGFGFDLREKPPSSAELAQAWEPWFAHCLECFGPKRCIFESNFHPDKSSGSFTSFWNAFKILAKKLLPGDETAQRALFYDNAVRVYRFDKFSNLPSTSKAAEAMSPPLPAH